MTITKKYAAFLLEPDVTGLSNDEIENKNYSFKLEVLFVKSDEKETIKYIEESMDEFRKEGVKNIRFVCLPVYFSDEDDIFK